MNIKDFIETAIKGGMVEGKKWQFVSANIYWAVWLDGNGTETTIPIEKYLLDPKVWQAVGKELGWETGNPVDNFDPYEESNSRQHAFLDSLQDGKSLSDAVNDATK